jgi:hypothetical protein
MTCGRAGAIDKLDTAIGDIPPAQQMMKKSSGMQEDVVSLLRFTIYILERS